MYGRRLRSDADLVTGHAGLGLALFHAGASRGRAGHPRNRPDTGARRTLRGRAVALRRPRSARAGSARCRGCALPARCRAGARQLAAPDGAVQSAVRRGSRGRGRRLPAPRSRAAAERADHAARGGRGVTEGGTARRGHGLVSRSAARWSGVRGGPYRHRCRADRRGAPPGSLRVAGARLLAGHGFCNRGDRPLPGGPGASGAGAPDGGSEAVRESRRAGSRTTFRPWTGWPIGVSERGNTRKPWTCIGARQRWSPTTPPCTPTSA